MQVSLALSSRVNILPTTNAVHHFRHHCNRAENCSSRRKEEDDTMGKVPPSLRTLFPCLPKNSPLSLLQQSPYPSPPLLTRHVPSSKKKQKTKFDRIPDSNSMFFKSPVLSDGKTFDSITLSTPPAQQLDLRFHNALLQSSSQISTPQESLSFLHHMTDTHPFGISLTRPIKLFHLRNPNPGFRRTKPD